MEEHGEKQSGWQQMYGRKKQRSKPHQSLPIPQTLQLPVQAANSSRFEPQQSCSGIQKRMNIEYIYLTIEYIYMTIEYIYVCIYIYTDILKKKERKKSRFQERKSKSHTRVPTQLPISCQGIKDSHLPVIRFTKQVTYTTYRDKNPEYQVNLDRFDGKYTEHFIQTSNKVIPPPTITILFYTFPNC